ncbi:MAG: efflux RND transporter permease subunit [Chloroflexi bacterium]|nr:efflux RND transporter permease subunit [Chloroflexota bacterium]
MTSPRGDSGPIAYMVGNSVGANLLMLGIVAAGLVSLTGLDQEAWPTLSFNMIEVSVAHPGATPEEIEESIVAKIEDQVASLEDVKTVRSVAAQGLALVSVELKAGSDIDRARNDIESAVGRIQSFPAGAERPHFKELTNRQSIMRLIVHGDVSERSLKEVAYQIEERLASLADVSDVETSAVRDYEISIEIPGRRLRALGLTLQDIAQAVRRSSLDISAGDIETGVSHVRVRALGGRYDQHDFEEIVVRASVDGESLRLGDIAEVRDGFQESALIVRYEGEPAAFVEVYRAKGESVAEVVDVVKVHVEETLVPLLPAGVRVTVWNDESQLFNERLELLLKNGSLGLLLVFSALALFLEIRLALWVAVGLVVSGIGALAVLLLLDLAINTFSLFAFVLAIGIVVDDAIVVAEHIHHERLRGTPGKMAAIRGARRIKGPLVFAVLTSVAAFSPLLFLPGGIGEIMAPLPIVLIAVLLISLVESLLVLPNHLSHLPGPDYRPSNPLLRFIGRIQDGMNRRLARFVEGPLDRWLRFATDQPGVVIAGALAILIVVVSLLPAGIVGSHFADEVDSDFVTVSLEMPDGTPAQRTHEVALEIEAAGRRVIDRISRDRPDDAPPLLSGVTLAVGRRPRMQGGGFVAEPSLSPQSNVAIVEFKLLSGRIRRVDTEYVLESWRDEVGILPEAVSLTYTGEVIPLGNPVEVSLTHPEPERLVTIANSVVNSLRELQGVFDVRSDHARGVREIQLELKPEARTFGLTHQSMAMQVRAAFFGEEALRVQRGQEEVRVQVRLPKEERDAIADVENYMIRTPGGADVPLSQVASVGMGTSLSSIQRREGNRVATVSADLSLAVTSGPEVNRYLEETVLAELAEEHPDMGFVFGGQAQQQLESFGALQRGFIMALLAIFAMLAIPLRSYTKPLIIMAVIPFGLIGAIFGHLLLGVTFTFISTMGFLGVSGVVVNDSLVMIDFINQKLDEGVAARTAIIQGAKERFRPIMLTSVTTFLGFTPLIFERATQAKFLARFAASMGFGILITTALLMLIVPALTAIHLRKQIRAG